MTSTEPTSPPERDELEVSLFGPGFGECVVVHAGWGDWLIVDSCLSADGKTPAGLAYLRGLGVEPATAVTRVVATHWHNDHVRGLAQTMEECPAAKFVCSQALLSKEFIALTGLWRGQRLVASPVSEMRGVLDAILKVGSVLKGAAGDSPIGFASANRCIWRRPAGSTAAIDTSAELHSLSPSDTAIRRSMEAIARLFPSGPTLTQPAPSRPNQFSVALWLRAGSARCLLGADLEERENPGCGWSLIVESSERPPGQASLFKVPHHGSVTADCESVWTRMLLSDPLALVTPFRSGWVRLPTPDDAQRMCARTPHAYITAPFRQRSSRGKVGSVNRTIHETVRYIRSANDSFGHVRARRKIEAGAGEWSVALFGDARRLSELYGQHSA